MRNASWFMLLVAAAVIITGFRPPVDNEHATPELPPPSLAMPRDRDIFAVTFWQRARSSAGEPVREAAPAPDQTARSATQEATMKARWLYVEPQDVSWEDKFTVTDKDVRAMIKTYRIVTQKQWKNVSQVSGADLSGWLIMKDGTCIQWMMKPGGLGWLRSTKGDMIYLSATPPPGSAPATSETEP